MLDNHIKQWLGNHQLQPTEVDCTIAVMLKIIDGKCKMQQVEKQVMMALYDQVKMLPHRLLDSNLHQLIVRSRDSCDEELKLKVYEERVLAETIISRPLMKAFKARIRDQGLFNY